MISLLSDKNRIQIHSYPSFIHPSHDRLEDCLVRPSAVNNPGKVTRGRLSAVRLLFLVAWWIVTFGRKCLVLPCAVWLLPTKHKMHALHPSFQYVPVHAHQTCLVNLLISNLLPLWHALFRRHGSWSIAAVVCCTLPPPRLGDLSKSSHGEKTTCCK